MHGDDNIKKILFIVFCLFLTQYNHPRNSRLLRWHVQCKTIQFNILLRLSPDRIIFLQCGSLIPLTPRHVSAGAQISLLVITMPTVENFSEC